MALDATIAGTSSNSYVTRAEADAYFLDRLNSSVNGDWTNDSAGVARTTAVKDAALITATRRIDEEQFLGLKVYYTQALKWPRVDVYNEEGYAFLSTTIPERVKQATFMTALELLKADYLAENYLRNYSFLSTGTMQFKQFTQESAGRLPAEAMRLLRLVMAGQGGGRVVRA